MKIAFFSAHNFEKEEFLQVAKNVHQILLIEERFNVETAHKAAGCEAVIVFANDDVCDRVLNELHKHKVKYISTRSVGYNNIDLGHAKELGFKVGYVPDFSPYAIAEHAVALMLALNRKLIESQIRVKQFNFIIDGLKGFDMFGKTVGIIGTGSIGSIAAKILHGFGCHLLAYDIKPINSLSKQLNIEYTSIENICKNSDIITLHVPLNTSTKNIINSERIKLMKKGVMLINTARGGLLDTQAVLDAVNQEHIAYLGLDVYENEEPYFMQDFSNKPMEDKLLAQLIGHENIIITAHQAFLTSNALKNIAEATFYNINCWANGFRSKNEIA